MKMTHEWVFIGYGFKTDTDPDKTGHYIVHLKLGETFEEAVERAKEGAYQEFERMKKNA